MSEAKIEIKVGAIEFSGQGEQEWVAKQLDKLLAKAHDLIKLAPQTAGGRPGDGLRGEDACIASMTLPSFLAEKGASKNQVLKFLATAVWLQAKGSSRVSTGDVTKALKDANQARLANPSDCLSKNVAKGHCEKDGGRFFVTEDGSKSLQK